MYSDHSSHLCGSRDLTVEPPPSYDSPCWRLLTPDTATPDHMSEPGSPLSQPFGGPASLAVPGSHSGEMRAASANGGSHQTSPTNSGPLSSAETALAALAQQEASAVSGPGGKRAGAENRCFNCNSRGHISWNCPHPSMVLCYNCQQVGHRTYQCPHAKICHVCGGCHVARECPSSASKKNKKHTNTPPPPPDAPPPAAPSPTTAPPPPPSQPEPPAAFLSAPSAPRYPAAAPSLPPSPPPPAPPGMPQQPLEASAWGHTQGSGRSPHAQPLPPGPPPPAKPSAPMPPAPAQRVATPPSAQAGGSALSVSSSEGSRTGGEQETRRGAKEGGKKRREPPPPYSEGLADAPPAYDY